MGIQHFSKVFASQGELKYKDLAGKWVAIDAMYQLHRTAHPFRTTKSAILTAPDGTATNHINGLLALILNLKKCGAHQVWIFDHPNGGHDSLKDIEVERRKSCRVAAKQKLQDILDQPTIFSDSEDEEKTSEVAAVARNKYERAAFSLEMYMITDLKFMLDSMDVAWIESPKGFEAEQLAAHMTNTAVAGILADAVLTPDPDCLLFGARLMLKNDKQKLYKYNLAVLLQDAALDIDGLIKVGIALGCDFAEKTAGVGPKTVIKKLPALTLSERQQEAFQYFKKPICPDALATLRIHGANNTVPFSNPTKLTELFEWLKSVKGFNAARLESRFRTAKVNFTHKQ